MTLAGRIWEGLFGESDVQTKTQITTQVHLLREHSSNSSSWHKCLEVGRGWARLRLQPWPLNFESGAIVALPVMGRCWEALSPLREMLGDLFISQTHVCVVTDKTDVSWWRKSTLSCGHSLDRSQGPGREMRLHAPSAFSVSLQAPKHKRNMSQPPQTNGRLTVRVCMHAGCV